jgi:hypothetical protein
MIEALALELGRRAAKALLKAATQSSLTPEQRKAFDVACGQLALVSAYIGMEIEVEKNRRLRDLYLATISNYLQLDADMAWKRFQDALFERS